MGLIRSLKISIPCRLRRRLSVNVDYASSDRYLRWRCSLAANLTDGSGFEVNMDSAFSTLKNEAPSIGFSKTTEGQRVERVYGLVQCWGDVDKKECGVCLSWSTV